MSEKQLPRCAACPFKKPDRICFRPGGRHPDECPTANFPELVEQSVRTVTEDPELLRFARESAIVEGEAYVNQGGIPKPVKSRIEETMDFARRMDYKRLGLVFCMGLSAEAATVLKILEKNGFETASVVCKVGGIPKEALGVPQDKQLRCGHETTCNPTLQAEVCNAMDVDFAILLGLCVGHDSMALRALKAPATVLAVKDRLLGHNPLAAIYTSDVYHRYLTAPKKD